MELHVGKAAVACAVAVACAAAAAQGPSRLPAAPRVLWRAESRCMSDDVPVFGELVYTFGNTLEARRLGTGEIAHRAGAPGRWTNVTVGGLVFARERGGELVAFVPDLSRELWRVPLATSYHQGTAHGDMFFVTSGTELLAITGGKVHWRFDLGSRVIMQPATDGRAVFAGSEDGVVVAVDLNSGKPQWRRDTAATFAASSPSVADGVLYLADRGVRDGRGAALNAFDATTGDLRWSTEFGATGFSRPSPHGNRVWAGFGTRVVPFEVATGALLQQRAVRTGRNPFGRPAVVGDALAFGNLDGNFYVHDVVSGELLWRFEIGTGARDQVYGWTLHRGVLLLATSRGVFAIGETAGAEPAPKGFVLRDRDG